FPPSSSITTRTRPSLSGAAPRADRATNSGTDDDRANSEDDWRKERRVSMRASYGMRRYGRDAVERLGSRSWLGSPLPPRGGGDASQDRSRVRVTPVVLPATIAARSPSWPGPALPSAP